MELYYFDTMNPRKVCVTAKYLDIPLEYHRIDAAQGELTSPAHLDRNPNAKVPVLVDGDLKLWESVAIMVHLATQANSSLWPANDPAAQVEQLRWISWDLCHWAPHAGQFYFEYFVKPNLFRTEPDAKAADEAATPLQASAKILDAHLAHRKYVAGDSLSIADFCLGVLLPYAQEIHLPLSDFSNIQRWHDRLMKLEAWRNPWPS